MANRERGEVDLPVGDRVFTLRLTIEAITQLEDRCSTKDEALFYPDILSRIMRGSVKHTRLLIWACLIDKHPDLTVVQAGELIDQCGGFIGLSQLVERIVETTRPDPEDRVRP